MHDNFESGVDAASGDYVAVVIDKTVLHPSALEVADRALDAAGRHRHLYNGRAILTRRGSSFQGRHM